MAKDSCRLRVAERAPSEIMVILRSEGEKCDTHLKKWKLGKGRLPQGDHAKTSMKDEVDRNS